MKVPQGPNIQGTNIDANASKEYGMPVGIYVYKIVEGGAAANSDLKEKGHHYKI